MGWPLARHRPPQQPSGFVHRSFGQALWVAAAALPVLWSREAGSVTGPAMLSEGGYCFVTGIALPGLWL